MPLKLITAPAVEPISLAEAKAHLRVDAASEDTLIGLLIGSARQAAEHELGRSLITQTWELVLDAFPAGQIEIPAGGVASVVSVKYHDAAGVEQTLDTADYIVDTDSTPAHVVLADGSGWPSTADRPAAVRVRFIAGFGATAADVPASIRHWMLLHIGSGYANRESVAAGAPVVELPGRYHAALLDPYRVYL